MPVESATRLPAVLLGALTSVLIFLVVSELFGPAAGLTAAALWAFDPQAVGFNRIAKEDSFFLFFFLLGSVFWLRGQRVAEEGRVSPEKFYWLAAASFGAMMASKYVPHLFAIPAAYYWIFQAIPATRWRLGKIKWLAFFSVMTLAFLACNPTILLPATWHEMRVFAGERRIGHDSYEFLGTLNRNQMTLWLSGSPWYFYYVFMAVKLPLLTVVSFCVGLPLLFKKRLGDGRFFVLFWLFFWFFPFTVLGGKFTRYFTFALPVVLITAALGVHAVAGWLKDLLERSAASDAWKTCARTAPPLLVVLLSAYASASAAPFYRLYTNAAGGGHERAGTYFPHDEFYDGSLRDTVSALLPHAREGATVASETPELVTFYARRAGRADISSVSLSDSSALGALSAGDLVLVARGRRYFSNEKLVARLRAASRPAAVVPLGGVPSAEVFLLDEPLNAALRRPDAR
ncbi:MAG TPA: glycosyltransferase family 39 protein [Pyrinomonadaceae bacterium]|nr:glycosyltransferase family 39 protein [Pyrinomonadaceae bacterium]